MNADSRFWSRVDKTGDCWIWTGPKRTKGYGLYYKSGKNLVAHRVAWESVNGPVPDGMLLDHKCHCPACVNPAHLRIATNTQNQHNALRRCDNTSGLKGVSFDNQRGKWKAAIRINGKHIRLGRFLTKEAAHAAYCAAATTHFGEYANGG